MAKFKSLIGEFRGTVGGITFSRSFQGNYVKAWSKPVDRNTIKQMNQRQLTAYLARLWRSASIPQKLAWTHLASLYPRTNSLGETYYLTAFQIYMAVNRNLQAIYEPITIDCPPISSIVFVNFSSFEISVICTPGSEDMSLNFTPNIATDEKLILQSSGVISTGISSPTKWTKIGVFDNSFISGTSIKQAYLNQFGVFPEVNDKLFFQYWRVKTTMGFADVKEKTFSIGTV